MFHRFHRRPPSNPTSPLPDQLAQWDAVPIHEHPRTAQDVLPRPDMLPRASNSSNTPPLLPPIARVASPEPELVSEPKDADTRPPSNRAQNGSNAGFIGGAALQSYRRDMQEPGRPQAGGDSIGSLPQSHLTRAKPPPPPINTSFIPSRPPPMPPIQVRPASSFVTPTDLQTSAATGKRPAGTRLATEPTPTAAAHTAAESQKARKGLPFLRNPVSNLLGRKKGGPSGPDGLQLPSNASEEPIYAPIRGTRVHDFSAPRPRRLVLNELVAGGTAAPRGDDRSPGFATPNDVPYSAAGGGQRKESEQSLPGAYPERGALGKRQSDQTLQERLQIVLDQKPLPEHPIPPVPPKDGVRSSAGTTSTKSRSVSVDITSTLPKSTPSTTSSRSRNISVSERSTRDGVMPALPKHMKSTSSRFSFMVGSASQEKLLEERHRQRELEKKTAGPGPAQRDSRFDDFDEDGFDYDAMMDDDGLEERIPGVNADAEEDDYDNYGSLDEAVDDPDNDQENFSGFVFQRSKPDSTLPTPLTPGMAATPRDAHGAVIGFAVTKDTPPEDQQEPEFPISSMEAGVQPKTEEDVGGLGIHGLNMAHEQNGQLAAAPVGDDLYFDQGLIDELNFGDPEESVPFDESIFDNNDTDQYGRPIPGAFALAKAQAMQTSRAPDGDKRESVSTTRLSGASQLSQSTAHTSLSVGPQPFPSLAQKHDSDPETVSPRLEPQREPEQDRVAAYQAALAEAAHKAAASGKFRRDSSPPPVADLTLTSSTAGTEPLSTHEHLDHPFDDYDDVGLAQDMNDYDFDDDAIIAEANAEALANDMDGFYGQEFGFFPAPTSSHSHPVAPASSAAKAPLNAQNLYEYSNGGYFGPSGLGHTASGRIVSREPNLTPITERSEYSNRNSIMSLAVPAIGSNGEMRSPGLAQLAMMADDGDMTLSALMRLRNKAFGGSQVSLANSSRDGSPMSTAGGEREGSTSPWAIQSGYLNVRDSGHGRKNSAFSIRSRDSEPGSGRESPILTMNFATMPAVSPVPIPPPLFSPSLPQAQSQPQLSPAYPSIREDDEATGMGSLSTSGLWMKNPSDSANQGVIPSPNLPPSAHRPKMGHRHKGSADSISYTKEKEEDSGETRWVMERRRTGESGEVEILEREVVEGGRI